MANTPEDPVLSGQPTQAASPGLSLAGMWHEFARPEWRLILLMLPLSVVIGLTVSAQAWVIEPIVDRAFSPDSPGDIQRIAGAVVLIALIRGTAVHTQANLLYRIDTNIIASARKRMWASLMHIDPVQQAQRTPAMIVSHFLYDSMMLREAMSRSLMVLGKDSVAVIGLLGVMFYQSWRMALAALLIVPLAALPISLLSRRMRAGSHRMQEASARLSARIDETLHGFREVKANRREAAEQERAGRLIDEVRVITRRTWRNRASGRAAMEILIGLMMGLLILYGGLRIHAGETTPGALFSFLTAVILTYQPLKNMATVRIVIEEGRAAAERLLAVIRLRPRIVDRPHARPITHCEGALRFEQVSFAWPDQTPALDRISLEIRPRTTIALVGPSGAGKSTLMNMVPRFLEPSSGTIRLDGHDLRDLRLADLRAQLSLVSQVPHLFDDTIEANLRYTDPNASQEQIRHAARLADADGFIRELPEGYQTRIGLRGSRLSGGQAARIALARALLRPTPILLLDEATAALDSAAEAAIQEGLRVLCHRCTTLVIAHRFSTIRDADWIFVMERGRIMAQGTHAELSARGGLYAQFHEWQKGEPSPSKVQGDVQEDIQGTIQGDTQGGIQGSIR